MHTKHAARCHFAGVPEGSVDGNDEGPANLRSVGPGARKWVLGSRLGLDSESERTHHVLAISLLIGQFSPQTVERLSSPPRQQLQQRAQVRSCAEQQICAMLCEAFGLVRLASAGQGLGWQKSDVDAFSKTFKQVILGKAGLQRLLRHSQADRWGWPEPSASNGPNFDLLGRRPLPKMVVLMGHASICPVGAGRGYLNVSIRVCPPDATVETLEIFKALVLVYKLSKYSCAALQPSCFERSYLPCSCAFVTLTGPYFVALLPSLHCSRFIIQVHPRCTLTSTF